MPGPGNKLIGRAVNVLDELASKPDATPSDLAKATGEPRSSVYRLLAGLQALDLVQTGARPGTFRLGLKLIGLSGALLRASEEWQAALPTMQRLHEQTHETVFLCVRRGMRAICLGRIDGRRVQSLALGPGGLLPLHAGAGPRILLAYEDRNVWKEYLDGPPLTRLTSSTPVTAAEILPLLEQARATGIAISDGDVTTGVAALGVPVFGGRDVIRASLSISGVRPSILGNETEPLCGLLIDAGREISIVLQQRST